jgi:HlyD family secretion protein
MSPTGASDERIRVLDVSRTETARPSPEWRSPVHRWIRRAIVLLLIVAVGVILRLTVWRPEPIEVEIFTAETGRVEATVVNSRAGTVESRLRAEMSPGIAGLVATIDVEKGERVRRGQVLLRLDAAEHEANARLAERSLDASRASGEEACLSAEQAARDLRRAEGLAARNLASEQDLEDAQTHARVTEAECTAAGARVRQAEASLALAQATLDKTTMRAPFDGVVLDVTTEVGEWISPSPPGVMIPPVIDVIAPDSLYVSAPIDEADVAEIRVGQPCRITLDAYRGRDFPGRVTSVASYVESSEQQNRTLEVEAVFLEGDLPENLLPGLSADVEVILQARDQALRIPTYALLEGDRVLIVEGDHLESRTVQTGLRNWEFAEITGGIEVGARVVTSLDRPEVKAGVRVRVVEAGEAP